ncbi:acyl-CoA dehydrogenase family protein [Henriciella marina]|uniref:Acyl-CoA dehydrogenase family protein n=1 Tax=Henriciella marina TaxID=453851 RepID=A0ABT4LQ03_9PROT|nr:acyl-CoA dehydrogenase family protein [Henriciella marina]MCZ4296441.1 acyl-CoA dehydrogenase family protein [Henriciella marina]
MISFDLTDDQKHLHDRVRGFIQEKIIPLEEPGLPRQIDDAFRQELIALAKDAGLLSPHVPKAFGGMGLNHVDMSIAFMAAGYSLLGPVAMNCAAPDEGNMNLLYKVATDEQKERWLRPLAAGDARSCFAMTEPAPGAGSDPSLMQTTYRKDGNEFVISGRKWLITGAHGAGFAIIMARPESGEEGAATMFFADMDTAGIEIVRDVATVDRTFTGGHAEVEFKDVRVPESAILGEEGQGFRYAQVRLAPARLTHCMRWWGAAKRCHDIATDYARTRMAFGKSLMEHEGVGFLTADNEIDLHLSQLSIWHTAWTLDQGKRAGRESSLAKVACSEALDRVADRSQQILGGMGVSHDTVVAQIATEMRGFRIYDGPSEVHRWSLARRLARG